MEPYKNFSHLSLKDLIEARDMFHLHLMNKSNVVATAVGRYLIRLDEKGKRVIDGSGKRRTLANSAVLEESWPCILVFVNRWQTEDEIKGANNVVPKAIYMP